MENVMSSTRNKLTPEQYAALAATPLPFTIIWSDENFEAAMKAAERGATMTYLGYLLEYKRTLLHNNPIYNDDEKSEKQKELLQAIPRYAVTIPIEELELHAAALNLYALLLKDTKNFTSARLSVESALRINNLSLLSKASLSHTLASIYDAEKNSDARLQKLNEAAEYLDQVELSYTVDKHIAASIYSSLGNIYFEKGDLTQAAHLHDNAVDLWPENNVIANNNAIFYSKQNSLEALQKAERALARHYEKAAAEKKFVTLYYRADVNIKLAGHAKASGHDVQAAAYLQCAVMFLRDAATAINANYTGSYRSKGLARLEYLAANIAYIEQDFHALERHRGEAMIYRTHVNEPQVKHEKFAAKFPTQSLFSTTQLYRRKPVGVAEVQVERKLSG
jgi:tetratricopeptide (TPR) repeat protein